MTRPLGTPLDHSSIPFQISAQSAGRSRISSTRWIARRLAEAVRRIGKTIGILKQQYALQQQLAGDTHAETQKFHDTMAMINRVRDKLANFDDFFRPIRSYFYWEKHCYDIPACFALRNLWDTIDRIDQLSEKFRTSPQPG